MGLKSALLKFEAEKMTGICPMVLILIELKYAVIDLRRGILSHERSLQCLHEQLHALALDDPELDVRHLATDVGHTTLNQSVFITVLGLLMSAWLDFIHRRSNRHAKRFRDSCFAF